MNQIFTSLLRRNAFFQKKPCRASTGWRVFMGLWLLAATSLSAAAGYGSLPGDTTLTAAICANDTYFFNGELLDSPGEYQAVLVASDGTDSIVTLQLNVLPNPLTNLNAAICEGSFYIFQGDTLRDGGNYSIILPAANGCDSIVRLKLEVVTYFDVQVGASICKGDIYVFGGDTLGTAGVYTDSLIASGGCDSVVTLTLKTLPVLSANLAIAICAGSQYVFHGDTLTLAGIYTDTLQAVSGCDSLVVLNLEVAPFFDVAVHISICAGEGYFFGNDTLHAAGVYVDSLTASGGCDSTVTLTLTVLPVQNSAIEETICEGAELEYAGISLSSAGIYAFVFTGENGCDSTVTLTLNVLPVATSALEATICQGETYHFNGETLTETGVYDAVFDAENGCDSTVTLTLTVLPTQQTTVEVSICKGNLYEYNGDTLTESGVYPYLFAGENGCDSTVTVVLTVNQNQSLQINATICKGEYYEFEGDSLTEGGIYTAIYTGQNGCDSVVTLMLDILPVQNTALEATICEGSVFEFNGENLLAAGVYTVVLAGENGCDSTVVLNLTVLSVQYASLNVTICTGESYEYNGESLTETGAYPFVFAGENGCDSTVTVNVTALPLQTSDIKAAVCEGEIYDYNGEALTESGSYEFVFAGSNGCDSIVTVTLLVLPPSSTALSVNLCEGASFEFNGDTLTASGTYAATYPGSNGCDSTVTLQLAFSPFFETNLQATICSGESYIFGNDTLTETGDYSLTLIASGGCDSVLSLTLTVLPLGESVSEAIICAGEFYVFNGESFTESGSYTVTLAGSNGCDSVAVLHLIVLPRQETILSATVCAGETYPFNGDLLTESGIYTVVLTGSNGCDSIVTLNLLILPIAQNAFAVINCNGESYEYNGEVLTESGIYEFVSAGGAANGCDSLTTLYLTIFPLIPPTEFSAAICAGGAYDFQGTVLTSAGSYSFDLASTTGCDSTVVLHLTVQPTVTTTVDAVVCKGEGYNFNGVTIFDDGTYTDTLQTANGCDSIAVLHLTVITVSVTVELQNGTLTAEANNATFQWFDCDLNQPVSGANDHVYTPAVTGNYAVVASQSDCVDTSACFFVEVVSVNEPLPESAWIIQPNPARLMTSVVFRDPLQEELRLEIYDATGRVLRGRIVHPGTTRIDLDLEGLPDGLLLVRMGNERGLSAKRVVKTGN